MFGTSKTMFIFALSNINNPKFVLQNNDCFTKRKDCFIENNLWLTQSFMFIQVSCTKTILYNQSFIKNNVCFIGSNFGCFNDCSLKQCLILVEMKRIFVLSNILLFTRINNCFIKSKFMLRNPKFVLSNILLCNVLQSTKQWLFY